MLNNYIQNTGISQTILRNNNQNHFNQVDWDAKYDGNIADIRIHSNDDGKRNQMNISLNNDDLANILNIPSVNMPLDKRLELDFDGPDYEPYFLDLSTPELKPQKPLSVEDLIKKTITIPDSDDEFIVPIKIDRKSSDKYTLTPKKRHKRHKTHITHKIYKKPKSKTRSKTKTKHHKSSRKTMSLPIIDFINSI
jgi:hypothetical protein